MNGEEEGIIAIIVIAVTNMEWFCQPSEIRFAVNIHELNSTKFKIVT